ncbi:hypothetical protein E8E13_002847 [Curvularia kusanoi]|uniref:Uncharacterized protein n=1 Tax=Curvularia kusanoi TaxID=90978 RepID=A0A9P4T4Y7_CURKU|nr:hypothetical protein E8E13_002847 [Curvularia kusanoi]
MARTSNPEPEAQALSPLPEGTRPLLRHGSEAVAYHIPVAPSVDDQVPIKTTIALPRRSAWTSGLHFHASHTEYLRLVKGAIFVELGGQTKFISALRGGEIDKATGELLHEGLVVEVPRFTRHNWGRLEHYNELHRPRSRGISRLWDLPEDWDEEVVVEEWTDPIDIGKPLFFWNLNGIITAPSDLALRKRHKIAKNVLGSLWIDLQLFVVFWELDNWPILVDFRKQLHLRGKQGLQATIADAAEIVASFILLFLARILGLLLDLQAVSRQRTPDALWDAYKKSPRNL